MPRTLLVLTYEFPPTGGAGVQRVLKWVRYLPEFGWEPVVVTTRTGWSRPSDPALSDEVAAARVIRTRPRNAAWTLARAFSGLKRSGAAPGSVPAPGAAQGGSVRSAGRPLSSRLASWVTVPDAAMPWIGTAVSAALDAPGGRPDAVLATMPPYSVGIAGMKVAEKLGVPLVTDLRDAWAGNVSHAYPTSWHRARSLALQGRVMSASALVTAAAETAAEEALAYGAHRAEVIHNGFDEEMPLHQPSQAHGLRLVFLGRFFAATDPEPLFQAIAMAVERGADVSLEVVGPVYERGVALAARLGLSERVTWTGFVPRADALSRTARADVGVIMLSHSAEDMSWYPLKTFEYMGMRLPSLIIGPVGGVASRLVARASAGWPVEAEASVLADKLAELAAAQASGGLSLDMDEQVIAGFSRRAQTERLASLLDEVAFTSAAGGGR